MDDTRVKTRAFLGRFFQHYELHDNDDIFGLGFVNSLFAMQLVLYVEQEFGITVENEDLDIDNFRSIDAIVQLVDRKTAALMQA